MFRICLGVCTQVGVCACECGGYKLMLDVLLKYFTPYSFYLR